MTEPLTCERAEDFLARLPDAYADAIVTDPPFGLGKEYAGARESHNDAEAYGAWLRPIYAEMCRVVKPGGFIAVWQPGPYLRHAWDWFGNDIIIYAAAKNFVQLRKKVSINQGWDPVVIRYKPGAPALKPESPKRNVNFFVANTASMVADTTRPERAHPYPRPIDQVLEIVRNFTLPGGVVLDPFVGSGTTYIACEMEGRRFEGCDIEPSYHGIVQKRLDLLRAGTLKVPKLSPSVALAQGVAADE